MKAYVNRYPVRGPWGGGNLWTSAFHEYAPAMDVELVASDTIQGAPDVIMLAGLDNDGAGISAEQAIMYKMYMSGEKDIKLVMRVNENDARKGTSNVDDMLLKVSAHIDSTVFVSRWLQDYFNNKGWACPKQTVIYNGVSNKFQPMPKIGEDKVHIVTHHWSDNYLKGFDVYDKLDEFVGLNKDKFTFTYVGRDRGTFKNTKVVKPLHGKALAEELGKYDVYVSASRFDPGPNHVLEALACKIPTYVHKDGGGSVEFAGSDHVYSNWDQLERILREGAFAKNIGAIVLPRWEDCIKQYVEWMKA